MEGLFALGKVQHAVKTEFDNLPLLTTSLSYTVISAFF